MARHLFGVQPLSEQMLDGLFQLDPWEEIAVKFELK